MKQLLNALYAAGHKPFDLPIERLVAFLRVVLTLFCIISIVNYPVAILQYSAQIRNLLAFYAIFGLFAVLLPTIGRFRTGWQLPVHLLDMGFIAVLMYFGQRLSIIFFVLYLFVLLGATFRWNWRGALWTTAGLTALQTILFAIAGDSGAAQFFVQLAFLLIVGGVFVFFGVSRERNENSLAQLAAWPSIQTQSKTDFDSQVLDASLSHIADVLRAPRILLVWEIDEEPYCFETFLVVGSKSQQIRVPADVVDQLVAKELGGLTFAAEDAGSKNCITVDGPRSCSDMLVNADIGARYNISSVCSAPLSGELCRGRLFLLDRSHWLHDDLRLVEIAASRLQIELQYNAIWIQLMEMAAARERVRLARDLHDGVLQGLTAIGLRLASFDQNAKQKSSQDLKEIRKLVLEEQKRIRGFVEGHQQPLQHDSKLQDELRSHIARLERQWGCSIKFSIKPQNTTIPQELVREIEFLLAEAAANAVQHGKASRIIVTVKKAPDQVRLQIDDNGSGLAEAPGSYSHNELLARGVGPQSISKRVVELGGDLTLSTSSQGIKLSIDLPCIREIAGSATEKAHAIG